MDKLKTEDIALAGYLKILGYEIEVKRKNRYKGIFYFDKEAEDKIKDFYNGDGKFQEFNSTIRALKAQIANTREGE